MDRVGGLESLRLLEEDARRFDDILIVMQAEAQAKALANG